MVSIVTSRRRQLRYSIGSGKGACVEFEHPTPNGRHFRLTLTDLSASGISFSVSGEDLTGLGMGESLPQAQIRVADCLIQGDLVVMHRTETTESNHTLGALFYPASDEDLVKLKSVIAGMEAVDSD